MRYGCVPNNPIAASALRPCKMSNGFFKTSKLLTVGQPAFAVPKCGQCGLYKTCRSPKMKVSGKGQRKILIVGEAPGREEDERGKPFVGPSGRFLEAALARAGIDMRRDCWITNSLICRPPSNATPTDYQLAYCRPNLTRTIRELKPIAIATFGDRALRTVLDGLWRDETGQLGRWVGWSIPTRPMNAWVLPTWHPAYLLRQNDPATNLWFDKHLGNLAKIDNPPWAGDPPDYQSQIDVVLDTNEAALRIRQNLLLGDFPAAFDYETTMLKPEGDGAEIVCCSICWGGRKTIAYPWSGAAIEATKEFLRSPCPKIASNLKFEERWTQRMLGIRVRNWAFDTMQAAHVLDNRPGITSIKFQAFVRLGVPIYDQHIKRFLISDGTMKRNRVKDVHIKDLLMYCGLDSLLEYKVAEIQMKELGYAELY